MGSYEKQSALPLEKRGSTIYTAPSSPLFPVWRVLHTACCVMDLLCGALLSYAYPGSNLFFLPFQKCLMRPCQPPSIFWHRSSARASTWTRKFSAARSTWTMEQEEWCRSLWKLCDVKCSYPAARSLLIQYKKDVLCVLKVQEETEKVECVLSAFLSACCHKNNRGRGSNCSWN